MFGILLLTVVTKSNQTIMVTLWERKTMENIMAKSNVVDEVLRERRMLEKGKERYERRYIGHKGNGDKRRSSHNNPHNIIKAAMSKVSKDIQQSIEKEKAKEGGRPSRWYIEIKDLDVDILAYLGLVTCFEAVTQGLSQTSCVVKIAERIEREIWSKELQDFDNTLPKNERFLKGVVEKVTKDHASEKYRKNALSAIAKKKGFKSKFKERWKAGEKIPFAEPVINAVLRTSGVFEIWEKSLPMKTHKMIGLTDEARLMLDKMDFDSMWNEPMLAPITYKPTAWEEIDTGCYKDEAVASFVPLVRAANAKQRQAIRHQLKLKKLAGDTPDYIKALNAIQDTPLSINKFMLEVVNFCWETGELVEKFPRKEYYDYPERPENYDDLDSKQKKGWRLKCKERMIKNREVDGARAVFDQDIRTARELSEYKEFYLPWNLCFRGRCYPVPFFNYHRDSHIKSLFLFSNKQKVTSDGFNWLCIHIANVGDFNKISKASLDERLQWAVENQQMIYNCGRNFIENIETWKTADKPFEFLAAAHEFANIIDDEDYECGLPIAIDGTNSGVQHYAAASLSATDGEMVNLTNTERPQDVYQKVADNALMKLQKISDKVDLDKTILSLYPNYEGKLRSQAYRDRKKTFPELAKLWLDYGVSRSTVKRNCMTYGYSSKKYGFSDQLIDDFMKPLKDKVMRGELDRHPFQDVERKAASFLAAINYQAIEEVISSVADGMEFFQATVDALTAENKAMRWETPIGFPVVQKYTHWNAKKVRIFLYDRVARVEKRSQITVRERDENKIDRKKSRSAISPNIIHSMDASHLMSTVLHCKKEGINDFFVIHDSFATTINDTSKLYSCVREAFIDMYQDWCLYSDIQEQIRQQLNNPNTNKLKDIPKKGNLNLDEIRNSAYCFS